MHVAVVGVNTK